MHLADIHIQAGEQESQSFIFEGKKNPKVYLNMLEGVLVKTAE